jgi:hypothetical protein
MSLEQSSKQLESQAPPPHKPFVPQSMAPGFWKNLTPHRGHVHLQYACHHMFIQATCRL